MQDGKQKTGYQSVKHESSTIETRMLSQSRRSDQRECGLCTKHLVLSIKRGEQAERGEMACCVLSFGGSLAVQSIHN